LRIAVGADRQGRAGKLQQMQQGGRLHQRRRDGGSWRSGIGASRWLCRPASW
jgi:hypothetical protein